MSPEQSVTVSEQVRLGLPLVRVSECYVHTDDHCLSPTGSAPHSGLRETSLSTSSTTMTTMKAPRHLKPCPQSTLGTIIDTEVVRSIHKLNASRLTGFVADYYNSYYNYMVAAGDIALRHRVGVVCCRVLKEFQSCIRQTIISASTVTRHFGHYIIIYSLLDLWT